MARNPAVASLSAWKYSNCSTLAGMLHTVLTLTSARVRIPAFGYWGTPNFGVDKHCPHYSQAPRLTHLSGYSGMGSVALGCKSTVAGSHKLFSVISLGSILQALELPFSPQFWGTYYELLSGGGPVLYWRNIHTLCRNAGQNTWLQCGRLLCSWWFSWVFCKWS